MNEEREYDCNECGYWWKAHIQFELCPECGSRSIEKRK